MMFSNFLFNDHRPLILDTSVLINLHACTYGRCILATIFNDIVVSDVVVEELQHETSRRNGDQQFLDSLVEENLISIHNLTDKEFEMFFRLTSDPNSLDDGESATIAISANRNFRAVIDDRKGRSCAAMLSNGENPAWTLDLLRHPSVVQRLSDSQARDAVYFALRDGRMRIPENAVDSIVTLIGRERAFECTCLPNYRKLLKA